MRIAIATEENSVSAHFGRCATYTIVDIDNKEIMNKITLDNPGHSPGNIPEFLKKNNVEIIITGGIGGRAIGFFQQMGIGIISGVEGNINDVINDYIEEVLKSNASPCNPGAGKGYGIDKDECDHNANDHSH